MFNCMRTMIYLWWYPWSHFCCFSVMASYKLLTLNCRELNNPVKWQWLVTALLKYDIVFLQETHIKLLTSCILSSNRLLHQFHAPGSSKACGVAILLSKDLQFSVLDTLSDAEGIFVHCVINEANILWLLFTPRIATNSPFLNRPLVNWWWLVGDVLLRGDLNFVCDSALDRVNIHISPEFQSKGSAALTLQKTHHLTAGESTHSKLGDIIDQFDLVDT